MAEKTAELNRVSRTTPVVALAGFILKSLEMKPDEPVLLHTIGASAIAQCVKSTIRAKNILSMQNKHIELDAWFIVTHIDNDQERTGIVFSVALKQ